MSSKTNDAVKNFERALRHLHATYTGNGGAVARRNARIKVLASLRAVRKMIDAEFPVEAKPRKPKRQYRTLDERGLVPIANGSHRMAQLIVAGIKISVKRSGHGLMWLAPRWAVYAPPETTSTQLREAKRSPKARKALIALTACVGSRI